MKYTQISKVIRNKVLKSVSSVVENVNIIKFAV